MVQQLDGRELRIILPEGVAIPLPIPGQRSSQQSPCQLVTFSVPLIIILPGTFNRYYPDLCHAPANVGGEAGWVNADQTRRNMQSA